MLQKPILDRLSTIASVQRGLRQHLARVGRDTELFTRDGIAMLHEAANGSLRNTDGPATAALIDAAAHKRDGLERDIVTRVLALDAEHREL